MKENHMESPAASPDHASAVAGRFNSSSPPDGLVDDIGSDSHPFLDLLLLLARRDGYW